jgi:hypothetical protein
MSVFKKALPVLFVALATSAAVAETKPVPKVNPAKSSIQCVTDEPKAVGRTKNQKVNRRSTKKKLVHDSGAAANSGALVCTPASPSPVLPAETVAAQSAASAEVKSSAGALVDPATATSNTPANQAKNRVLTPSEIEAAVLAGADPTSLLSPTAGGLSQGQAGNEGISSTTTAPVLNTPSFGGSGGGSGSAASRS